MHKNKAKREWGVKSPLCSDCYLNKMQEILRCKYNKKMRELWNEK